MNYKDEINHLNSRITSLKYQLKQMNDFKEENISIKEGLESLREQIEKINEEKQNIKNNVNPVFNTFKKLISFNQSKYSAINASYDRDILSRMEKDNNYFSNNIEQIEKKTDELIDNLYKKVQKFISLTSSSENNNNNINFDINTIKFNLSNISNEFTQIFNEIQIILELSSKNIAEEEEETIRNIQFIEIIVQEVDRILQFVPFDQLIRNNLLAQLGINEYNYPLNTATLKIILLNMQEIKRKRQTQLRNILNQIKNISKKILQKKSKIENEILSALNFFQIDRKNNNNNNNNESLNLEDLFSNAKKINKSNIKEFEGEICGSLSKEIEQFKGKIEEKMKKFEDLKSKAKKEFINQWNQIKSKCCDDVLNHAKNSMNYYFNQRIKNYQKYEEITNVIKEKIYLPECKIINFGLLNCSDVVTKIKEDLTIIKCTIPIGKKNDYYEDLHSLLVKETHFFFYDNDENLSDISYNIKNTISKITGLNEPIVVFVVHFNNFVEFDKESYNIEKFIIKCLRAKAAFLFFFGKTSTKEIKSVNKKVKTWLEKNTKIQEELKENNYELSPDLCYNMERIKDGVEIEMEKITNFKKDNKYKMNDEIKNEFEEEYFNKMWDVYNSHSIASDLESIQNAKDEELCRSRLNFSLIDFSFLSLNLDKKPKERLIKDKDETAISNGIKNILDEIYANNLSKDFNVFMNEICEKKVFEMYLNREKLMGEIDLRYNTSLLTEEGDGDKIQKQIGEEIFSLYNKYVKKDALKFVGRLVWARVFEKYCPEFYKLMRYQFKIPENFEEYLIEIFNS